MDEDEKLMKEFERCFMRDISGTGEKTICADLAAKDPERFMWFLDRLGINDSMDAACGVRVAGVIRLDDKESFDWLNKWLR